MTTGTFPVLPSVNMFASQSSLALLLARYSAGTLLVCHSWTFRLAVIAELKRGSERRAVTELLVTYWHVNAATLDATHRALRKITRLSNPANVTVTT